MASNYRLHLLGPVLLERDGAPLGGFESRKALALLCYLVMRAQPMPRSHLVDLFWGDQPEARGKQNLRRVLYNLASFLPGWLHADRNTVQFQSDPDIWVDCWAFNRLVIDGTPRALTEAVNLSRGEFMGGLYLDDCAEFETWLVVEREHWRQRVAEAYWRLIDYHTQRRDYPRSQELAERLLTLEPWREEAHRELMRLLALSGQRSAALMQYETCRRLLADELGVEPTAETQTLYEQIRAADLLPVSAPLHNLPVPLTQFVGRERELADLARLLDDPMGVRVVSIVGLGGVGKTRLALAAAAQVLPAFKDGVCWVGLGTTPPEFLVSSLITALDLKTGPAEPRQQLLSYLRDKRMLLILDNFEHLLASTEFVVELLFHAPRVRLLVTSREPLHLMAESIFDLDGLPVAGSERGADGAEHGALQLFVQSAQRVRRDFALTPTTRPVVVRICQILRGLPLGIELAAALIRTHDCQHIAAEITRNLDFLATSMRDVSEQHRSLRAVFEHSWSLLSDVEQEVFRRLAVFQGGFDLDAARVVAGADARRLAALVDKSLLAAHMAYDRAIPTRYDLHDLMRQYALEKLDRAGESAATRDRHLALFVEMAERSDTALAGPEQAEWYTRLELEHGNLRAAMAWGLSVNPTASLRAAGSLWRFWHERSYYTEGSQWLSSALAHPEPEATEARAKALYAAGRLARLRMQFQQAIHWLEESVALYRKLENACGLSETLQNLGGCVWEMGDHARGIALMEEAVELSRQCDDPVIRAHALESIAEVVMIDGDIAMAARVWEESLALFRRQGSPLQIAYRLAVLGRIYALLGASDAARACLLESLIIRRDIGNKAQIAACLEGLAGLAIQQAEPDAWQAARLLGAAASLREADGAAIPEMERPYYDGVLISVRAGLHEAEFDRAWAEGWGMGQDEAVDLALVGEHPPEGSTPILTA